MSCHCGESGWADCDELRQQRDELNKDLAEARAEVERLQAEKSMSCWPAPATQKSLSTAVSVLRELLREEPLIYEGNLEAKLFVSVDALNAAKKLLTATNSVGEDS